MSAVEHWLPVVGWEGYYEVSDLGQVRSLARVVTRSDGRPRTVHARVLSQSLGNHGYLQVGLCKLGRSHLRTVHTLVAEAFHGPRPQGLQVCHGNGARTDNRAVNLRWDSAAANVRDAVRHGTNALAAKTHCPQDHPYDELNTHWYQGRRYCRACKAARSYADYRARKATATSGASA